jgi:hypothetical protein
MVQVEYLPIVLTGIGIIVSILYYTSVLRNANKARKGQLLMQAYTRLDTQYRIDAIVNMNQWKTDNFEEFFQSAQPDLAYIHAYFEGLAPLVRLGHLEIEYIAALIGGFLIKYWETLLPFKKELDQSLWLRWGAETEYLYNEVKKFMDQHPEYEY